MVAKDLEEIKVTENDAMDSLIKICDTFGWNIAIPPADEDDKISGVIIGTPDYIDGVLGVSKEAYQVACQEKPDPNPTQM